MCLIRVDHALFLINSTEGLDYTSSFGFEEEGQFCQQVSISSDSLVEGNEHFLLGLVTNQEFVQLTTANTTITIEDSDGQFVISILSCSI